jgi:hypothetical protein
MFGRADATPKYSLSANKLSSGMMPSCRSKATRTLHSGSGKILETRLAAFHEDHAQQNRERDVNSEAPRSVFESAGKRSPSSGDLLAAPARNRGSAVAGGAVLNLGDFRAASISNARLTPGAPPGAELWPHLP